MSNENENFKAEYLTEADEDNFRPQQRKPYIDNQDRETEQPDDSEFSVDQYEPSDEVDSDPMTDNGESDYTNDSENDMTEPEMDSDEKSEVDVDALYTDLADFFEDADEQKVKDWIQHVIETENLKDDGEFLDFFEGAEDMEDSFNSYGGDEEAKDAEKEATEPEDDHEEKETPEEAKEEEALSESYSQDLSDGIKEFMFIMNEYNHPLIKQLAKEAIEKIKDKLKETVVEESKKGVNPFTSKFTITFTNAKGKEKTKKVSAKNKKAAIAQFKEDNPEVEGKVSAECCDKEVVEENIKPTVSESIKDKIRARFGKKLTESDDEPIITLTQDRGFNPDGYTKITVKIPKSKLEVEKQNYFKRPIELNKLGSSDYDKFIDYLNKKGF